MGDVSVRQSIENETNAPIQLTNLRNYWFMTDYLSEMNKHKNILHTALLVNDAYHETITNPSELSRLELMDRLDELKQEIGEE